jgi:hypothetical protein
MEGKLKQRLSIHTSLLVLLILSHLKPCHASNTIVALQTLLCQPNEHLYALSTVGGIGNLL